MTAQASSLAQGEYWIAVKYSGELVNVDQSAPDGNCYAISNGIVVAAVESSAGATIGTAATGTDGANYSVHVYNNSDLAVGHEVTGAALVNALKSIGDKSYTVTATPTAQVRLCLSNTDGDDADTIKDVYQASLLSAVNVGTCTINGTNGTIALSSLVPFYYSVSGNTTNTTPTIGVADAGSTTVAGTIVFGLEA